MDEVNSVFLVRRTAKVYVDLYKAKGKEMADIWWTQHKWKPPVEDFAKFNNEVRRLLGQSSLPPKGVA